MAAVFCAVITALYGVSDRPSRIQQIGGTGKIDTIEDLVFHYTDVMDHLGLTQPYVAGLSLGGWIAAEFATHYPQRIRKLALLNAVGLRVPGAPMADIFATPPAETRHLLFYDGNSDVAKMFVPDVPSPEVLENTMKAREASARVGWNPYFCNLKLRDRLYRVTVPTLVIWGDSDRFVPVAHGKAYQEGIAGDKTGDPRRNAATLHRLRNRWRQ